MPGSRLLSLFLFSVSLGGAIFSHAQQPTVAERFLFEAANQERRAAGIAPLRWNPHLAQAARPHAEAMARKNGISHQFAGEGDLSARAAAAEVHFSRVAENVGMSPSPAAMHDAWMRSPGHRANILDAKLTSLGVSVIYRNGYLWAVQDFARDVEELSLSDQEMRVSHLLSDTGRLQNVVATQDARRSCSMSNGYAGEQKPSFVMRYSTSDLSHLPNQLTTRLSNGRYTQAAVGACASGKSNFSGYSIAVLLYP